MIVRPTRLLHPHGYELESHQRLRVGDEYLVLGIEIRPKGTALRILDEVQPSLDSSLWPVEMFEIVSARIPTSWRVAIRIVQDKTFLYVEPEKWLAPGFFEDFYADPPIGKKAREQFREDVLQMMLEESFEFPAQDIGTPSAQE
jgi:hypothetical protein